MGENLVVPFDGQLISLWINK